MHILLVAPSAPPKNSPEALQVRRFLQALDPAVRVTLVTTPVVHGWQWHDPSLEVNRPGLSVITVQLPFHRVTQRVLGNHRLSWLHTPDAEFWLKDMARSVLRQLTDVPDVIYSRSTPFSGALLARQLKKQLGLRWMMHLSDPWATSPYRAMSARRSLKDRALEDDCVSEADIIALTTSGQADHYRVRFPNRASNITVTPNMMPVERPVAAAGVAPDRDDGAIGRLKIFHIGALYGDRSPDVFLKAVCKVHARIPDLPKRLTVLFIGNMSKEVADQIERVPGCVRKLPITFEQAELLKEEADVLLSIEPMATNPLHKHFLMSKVVDYLSSGKPLLSLTPEGSVTAGYCQRGYGWSFAPDDVDGIAALVGSLVCGSRPIGRVGLPPPSELRPDVVTSEVESHLRGLIHHRPHA